MNSCETSRTGSRSAEVTSSDFSKYETKLKQLLVQLSKMPNFIGSRLVGCARYVRRHARATALRLIIELRNSHSQAAHLNQ